MANFTQVNTSIRMSQDSKDRFDLLFDASGANSKGEFVARLLDRYENPAAQEPIEKIVEVEKPVEVEKIIQVEKSLEVNQLLLTLTENELFALRETVLSSSDFAERQNELIDSLAPENLPFFYFGNLYDLEFQELWKRNIVVTSKMSDEDREEAIKHNMAAFLINNFFLNLLSEKITVSLVTPGVMKEFIAKRQKQGEAEVQKVA